MFRKRTVTVTVGPKNEEPQAPSEPADPQAFEKKATFVLHQLERTGIKLFAGICVFVLLDTYRQVHVAQANNPVQPLN